MWILQWGDNTNRASGQWNHEEHVSSEKALEAARTKVEMGLVAHAIHSPAGVHWMTADELMAALSKDEAPAEI